jgi:hypothetical protein
LDVRRAWLDGERNQNVSSFLLNDGKNPCEGIHKIPQHILVHRYGNHFMIRVFKTLNQYNLTLFEVPSDVVNQLRHFIHCDVTWSFTLSFTKTSSSSLFTTTSHLNYL